jgi:hypothetical protein
VVFLRDGRIVDESAPRFSDRIDDPIRDRIDGAGEAAR